MLWEGPRGVVGLTPGGSQMHKRRWRGMSALDIAMLNLLELRLKQEKSTFSLLTSHYWRACCSSLPWGAVGRPWGNMTALAPRQTATRTNSTWLSEPSFLHLSGSQVANVGKVRGAPSRYSAGAGIQFMTFSIMRHNISLCVGTSPTLSTSRKLCLS